MMLRLKKWQVISGGLVVVLVAMAVVYVLYARHLQRRLALSEAKLVLSEVMFSEEVYWSEHQEYFDVSGGSTAMHPRNKPTPEAVTWDTQTPIRSRFDALMNNEYRNWPDQAWVNKEGVRFVYTVLAGRGTAPKHRLPSEVHHWLPFKRDPWYIAIAMGDLDGDGEPQYLAATSEYRGVYVLNDD